jgi:Outer membrane protein beta-barrel domain
MKMSKCIFFAGLFTLVTITSFAQSSKTGTDGKCFGEGTKLVDAGIGLGSPYWGSGFSNSIPFNPRVNFESAVSENISVGGGVAYSGSSYKYIGGKLKYNAFFIAGRGAYHFATSNKLDPYAGVSAGYVLVSVSDSDLGVLGTATSGFGYGAFLGLRYYLKERLGLNAELGYSSFSFLNAGVSFKLK